MRSRSAVPERSATAVRWRLSLLLLLVAGVCVMRGALAARVLTNRACVAAGQHETIALQALEILCKALEEHQLLELNLSDNALGLKGVTACAPALAHQRGLRKLFFNNNGCGPSAHPLRASRQQRGQYLARRSRGLRRWCMHGQAAGLGG